MKWKANTVRYICEIKQDTVMLVVRYSLVGRYPLSYAIEECIEEFCERVGWDLNTITQEPSNLPGRVIGIISFQRPNASNVLMTVEAQRLNHS